MRTLPDHRLDLWLWIVNEEEEEEGDDGYQSEQDPDRTLPAPGSPDEWADDDLEEEE